MAEQHTSPLHQFEIRDIVPIHVGHYDFSFTNSSLFMLVAVETLHASTAGTDILVEVATWTILLSVLFHGVTAGPIARAYGRRIASGGSDLPELSEAPEPRVRRRGVAHP